MDLARALDGIPSVSGTAERAVLFPSPALGQKVYRRDTGDFEEYSGSAWQVVLGNVYSVARYAAKGDGTTDDHDAMQDAITAAPTGSTVWLPRTSSYYRVDNSGGLSDAIVINKQLTIRIDGEVRATSGTLGANPAVIFSVTGNDVTFEGSGSIRGDGTKNDTNTGTDDTMPCLVRVTGHRFRMRGLTIDTPPKIGVHLHGADDANITDCNFTGGPTSYSDTAYFAIRGYQGGRHVIANNHFYPDAGGGMYVNCIFLNNSNYCVVEGNTCYRPFEKLIYCVANYCVIEGNIVLGNSGTVPGTSQGGTVGPVFRVDGIYNKVVNNFSRYGGGAQSLGGQGCDISGNTFIDAGQSGVSVTGGSVPFTHLTIANNVCVCGNLAGTTVTSGIYVEPSNAVGVSRYVRITGNTVVGFSPSGANAQIRLVGTAADEFSRCVITDNNVAEGVRGIATDYMINSLVRGNRIHATEWGMLETNGGTNRYEANPIEGASNSGISGMASTSIADTPIDWTPVLSDGTNNATMASSSANFATYLRVGQRVRVTGQIATTALGSVTGAVRITGLPVAAASGIKHRAAITTGFASGLNITAGQNVTGYIDGGNSYIELHLWDAATGTTTLQATEWSDDGAMIFSLEYTVAQ